MQLLKRVAGRSELVTVALNTHGTRAVQKLIETLSSREQRHIAIEALKPGEPAARVAVVAPQPAQATRRRLLVYGVGGMYLEDWFWERVRPGPACSSVRGLHHPNVTWPTQYGLASSPPEQSLSSLSPVRPRPRPTPPCSPPRPAPPPLARSGVVSLIKDLNGNHVVQRCLQRLGPEDSQFIYDAAAAHCMEVATHRHGCCVLQRCIDFATPPQKTALVAEIARNALQLSQVRVRNARAGAWQPVPGGQHVLVWAGSKQCVASEAAPPMHTAPLPLSHLPPTAHRPLPPLSLCPPVPPPP